MARSVPFRSGLAGPLSVLECLKVETEYFGSDLLNVVPRSHPGRLHGVWNARPGHTLDVGRP